MRSNFSAVVNSRYRDSKIVIWEAPRQFRFGGFKKYVRLSETVYLLNLCICFNKALFVVWANIDHIKDENDKLFSSFFCGQMLNYYCFSFIIH